jgi:propanol-preferring alcohol dehydrogenase
MKAAVLQEFKTPLVLTDVPRPEPGPGEVLIAVEACGVCHSDLHVADGDWPQFSRITKKPLILGHEIAGHIVELGEGVGEFRVGDHVGVPWIYWTCGECEACREGNENLCSKQLITGVSVDGGYAEFMKARASHVQKIPDGLSSADVAPLFCAGVTVYRALSQARILPGQRLAVFGVGGLGHLAVQIGAGFGAEVTAVDISDEKLAAAAKLGPVRTLNSSSNNVVKEFRATGGAHIAIVTSASKAAYDTAFSCLRPRGTLLVVGLPAENICFPPIMMAAGEVRIQASAVGTRQDLKEVLAIAAAGKARCQVTARPLAQANDVLEEMRAGRIAGRVVLAPQ